jgi:hypothetical protein
MRIKVKGMVSFSVIEKLYNGEFVEHGPRAYHLAPRLREHITLIDEDGIAQVYQVIAVIHPDKPSSSTVGDLIVRHNDDDATFRATL